jgi:hypothetical protein
MEGPPGLINPAVDRMRRLITRWLPSSSVCHPYPLRRMGVIT